MKSKRYALPALVAAAAVFWLGCASNRATEVSRREPAPGAARVRAGTPGWVYLQKGQSLQIVGHSPFRVTWLFGRDPCAKTMAYAQPEGMSTAACTMGENATGAYAFEAAAGSGNLTFVRVGRAAAAAGAPLELVQRQLRTKRAFRVANVAFGCVNEQAEAAPQILPVEAGEFVSWTRLGSTPGWTVTFDGPQACEGTNSLNDRQPVCAIGAGASAVQSYSFTLPGCPKPGAGKLTVGK